MTIVWLTVVSSVSWFFSTLAGGGSPLVLIPVLSLFLSTGAIAPVITIGMLFGNAQRLLLYWQAINWQVTWWYLPGGIAGACLGAFVFTRLEIAWLTLLLGLFLVLSAAGYSLRNQTKLSVPIRAWYFLPAGFIYAFLSGLIGSTGPILNPFYLNYGLVKESMLATKAANVVIVHIAKILTYAAFGAFTYERVSYGILIGVAAFPGNWLGQVVLKKLSEERFRQIVVTFIALSGVLLFWQQWQLSFW